MSMKIDVNPRSFIKDYDENEYKDFAEEHDLEFNPKSDQYIWFIFANKVSLKYDFTPVARDSLISIILHFFARKKYQVEFPSDFYYERLLFDVKKQYEHIVFAHKKFTFLLDFIIDLHINHFNDYFPRKITVAVTLNTNELQKIERIEGVSRSDKIRTILNSYTNKGSVVECPNCGLKFPL